MKNNTDMFMNIKKDHFKVRTDLALELNEEVNGGEGRYNGVIVHENIDEDTKILIPTKNIYFFIEKIPLDYSVSYAGSGQSISKKGAGQALPNAGGIVVYQGENRWIVMSRMYYWAQAFMKKYPNEMKVYYEDDQFICYRIPQNMYHQYNFAIDYGYNQVETEEQEAEQ